MTDIYLVRGDSVTYPVQFLEPPDVLAGTWTWDGSLVVLSSDTSAVSVGDWIALEDGGPFFEVDSIAPNVSVTLLNPFNLSVPSGSGAWLGEPIDLTDAIVRFSVKKRPADDDNSPLISKLSYDDDEIEIPAPTDGMAQLKLYTEDTFEVQADSYTYDVELTRRDGVITSAGTIEVSNGSGIIQGTGLVLDDVKVGDVIEPAGGTAANQKQVLVTDVGGSGRETDPGAGNLLTDYTEWDDEAGVSLDVYRGRRDTPSGLRGRFVILQDVTK